MKRTVPSHRFPFAPVVPIFLIGLSLSWPSLAYSYTAEDIDKAKGDVTQLR